jgi:glycosyltransferase involved in cell wall biosynthesis
MGVSSTVASASSSRLGAAGVNVIGFFRAEFGHGEAGRRILAGIERAGIPHATIAVKTPHHREKHPYTARGDRPVYPTNVVCLNPEHMLEFAQQGAAGLFADRYTVGVWCWEASRFPDSFRPAFDLVDEVWVASEYVAEIIREETRKPVAIFPMPVEVRSPPELSRAELGLPSDRFVFLFAFDFFSTLERKNPFGLVEAFSRAFRPDEGPVLVIKTINGDKQPGELWRLRETAREREDIRIVDEYVSAEQMRGLVASCDCFVSLHRSEGFGLSIAEAMLFEKPVIATGYSGNLTFMDEENSYLVGFGLTPVPPGMANYPPGALWADPDLDDAATAMRRVVERPGEARERAARGRETLLSRHTLDTTARFMAERLGAIDRLPAKAQRAEPPVERAARYLAVGPSLRWDAPSGHLGGLGVFARKLLHRLLRPYLVRHREWESLVVEQLRANERTIEKLSERVAELERAQRDAAVGAPIARVGSRSERT